MNRRVLLAGLLACLCCACTEPPATESDGPRARESRPAASTKALALELARGLPEPPEALTAPEHAARLRELTATVRARIEGQDRHQAPLGPEELATFLPDLGGWVRGSDTHLSRHDFEGYRYSIAHRRYRTPAGLLDLDIVDTGGTPDLLAPFVARRALAMHDPDGPVRFTPGSGDRSLQWSEAGSGRQHLEFLLGDRILVRVAGPERMPGRRLRQAVLRIDHQGLRAMLRRAPAV